MLLETVLSDNNSTFPLLLNSLSLDNNIIATGGIRKCLSRSTSILNPKTIMGQEFFSNCYYLVLCKKKKSINQ